MFLYIRSGLTSKIEQYARVLQDPGIQLVNTESKRRIRQLLGSLVNQSMYHRDIMEGILTRSTEDLSLSWQKLHLLSATHLCKLSFNVFQVCWQMSN